MINLRSFMFRYKFFGERRLLFCHYVKDCDAVGNIDASVAIDIGSCLVSAFCHYVKNGYHIGDIDITVSIGIGSSELFFCKHIEFCYMTLNSGYVADIYISISIGIAEDKQLLVCQLRRK